METDLNKYQTGLIKFRQNKYSEAIKDFKSSYSVFLLDKDLKNAGKALNKIGESYLLMQQFRSALKYLLSGYTFRKEHSLEEEILESLNSLGEFYYYIDSYEKSAKYYEECISKADNLNNDYFLAVSLKNRGWLNFERGIPFKSIYQDLKKALYIAEKLNRKRLLLSCYDNLGDLFFNDGNYGEALIYFNKMLNLCNGTEYSHLEIRALKNIGNTHRELGDFTSAESFLIKSMNLAREKNILPMLRDCSLDKAMLFEKKHEYKKAYTFFKNYHQYSLKIEQEKSANHFLEIKNSPNNFSEEPMNDSINLSKYFGINEKFQNQLLMKFPDLSPRQIEIAGLIKTGMSSKEISVLLNIEVDSINKHRARIRKKMNLNRNQNLSIHLQLL